MTTEQIIAKPELNGRQVQSTGIQCPECKAARRKTISGAVPYLYRLAETDAKTAKRLASLGLPVAPITDAERGLFCLAGH